MTDYYELLGVEKSADAETIKKAYRELALKYHPDVCGDPKAEDKFKEINVAYETLSDPDKRQRYDTGDTGFTGMGNPFGGNPFGFNFVNDFFNMHNQAQHQIRPGTDVAVQYYLDIEETLAPIQIKIQYVKISWCRECEGQGGKNARKCEQCQGNGMFVQQQMAGFVHFSQTHQCPKCRGTGNVYQENCPKCNSFGMYQEQVEIPLDIPLGGINKRFVLNDIGNQEKKEFRPGRLIVDVLLKEHSIYQIENNYNCVYKLELDPIEAILGGEFEFPHLEGDMQSIKIPKGASPGYREEFKELGIPVNNVQRGSLIVEVKYKVPQDISLEQEELLTGYLKTKN